MYVSALDGDTKWLEYILDTIDEGIHAVDLDGATIVYNAAAARMDGLSPDDVLGRHVLSAFPSLGPDSSTLLRVLRTGRAIYNRPQTYTNFLGTQVHTVNTTLPIKSQGKIVGALEIAKDLTQVKKLSEQVLELQARMVGGQGKRRRTSGGSSQLRAKYTLDDILTNDPALMEIKRRADAAAQTTSPILVYGETGTGKELLVQSIHNAGSRQEQPFLALNCAAIPASLLEGMLFGTVRGSFTGAEDRPGLFELADGGTLFLDEVQSLPLDLQAKLLRVLQEGEVMRVGDTRVRSLNVRVVTAMNQRPEESVDAGSLRLDLYYRINVVRFDLPPLRHRPADIALLASHFITQFNRQMGTQVTQLSDEVLHLFQRYPWPGNVRELENGLESALNLVTTGAITMESLPNQLREWELAHPAPPLAGTGGAETVEAAGARPAVGAAVGAVTGATDSAVAAGPVEGTGAAGTGPVGAAPLGASRDASWIEKLIDAGVDRAWHALASDGPETVKMKQMLLAFEGLFIQRALDAAQGNLSLAAQRLSMPRQTLQYRLKQLQLGRGSASNPNSDPY